MLIFEMSTSALLKLIVFHFFKDTTTNAKYDGEEYGKIHNENNNRKESI